MSTGKKCVVKLLDGQTLELLVQPKLIAGDLLDIVSSHFNLREKEYFGLSFEDETGVLKWLRAEKRVLDHSFPKGAVINLAFGVRFYIPKICQLKENTTVELFFLQAKSMISQGAIDCDAGLIFKLAAVVLQAKHGDFVSDAIARADLKKLNVFPVKTLSEHPTLELCENEAIDNYRQMLGTQRGDAIVNYMNVVEHLPMYGIHYYEAKDKSAVPCHLGLSYRGIGQYDHADKQTPRKLFLWNQMENLYYREKKFSIEVRNVSKSPSYLSVNRASSLRRNAGQPIDIMTWILPNSSICRETWIMAVSQHQFYVERRAAQRTTRQRSLQEIAKELSRSDSSLALSFMSDISESCYSDAQSFSIDGGDSGRASSSQASPEKDAHLALVMRKENLDQLLQEKMDYLRHLCVEEAKITGRLPRETPSSPSCIVEPYRRKIGTSFEFPDLVLANDEEQSVNPNESWQRDYEIQKQICKAAQRLAVDPSAHKTIRRERKIAYQNALTKLKQMKQKRPEKDYLSQNSSDYDSNYRNSSNHLSTTESSENGSLSSMQWFDDGQDVDSLGPVDACSLEHVQYSNATHGSNPGLANGEEGERLQNHHGSRLLPRSRRGISATSEELLLAGRNQRNSIGTQFVIGEFGNSGIYHNTFGAQQHNSTGNHGGSASLLRTGLPHCRSMSLKKTNSNHSDGYDRQQTLDSPGDSKLHWVSNIADETLV